MAQDKLLGLFSPLAPLAERARPQSLKDFVGQTHLLGPHKILTRFIETGKLPSLILWGPPGTGKTTLARLLAKEIKAHFLSISAVDSGIKEMRVVVKKAQQHRKTGGQSILFVDEIHRFNRSQQDFLLPFVEDGTLILIGTTTENPSFKVAAPLVSRCRVLVLKPLRPEEIVLILKRALKLEAQRLRADIQIEPEVIHLLAQTAQGDARVGLNLLEALLEIAPQEGPQRIITKDLLKEVPVERPLLYDQAGEEHFNLISAFHKSLRGSDPDAALYWLVRMLEAGEDPLYIARRMIVMAAEDIGNADPQALLVAVAAKEAFEALGRPEGDIPLAQAALYLALAPKSNAVYKALKAARKDVKHYGALPVPLHLRNPETALMRALGYGEGYKYPHDFPEGIVKQAYRPPEIQNHPYYRPSSRGLEKILRQRWTTWRKIFAKSEEE